MCAAGKTVDLNDQSILIISCCKTDFCNMETSPSNTLKCNRGQKGTTIGQENCPGGTCAVREQKNEINSPFLNLIIRVFDFERRAPLKV